jgi:hypothetical protein
MSAETDRIFAQLVEEQLGELTNSGRMKRALNDPEIIEQFGGQLNIKDRQEYLDMLGEHGRKYALTHEQMAEVALRLAIRQRTSQEGVLL